jgi:uncharacterized protein YqeY
VPPDRSLTETLQAALATSRKAQDKDRTLLLGTLLAAVKNRQIESRRDLTDDEVIDVLRKGIKMRNDAAEQYEKARRPELADKERAEIGIIEDFLPPPPDPEEIRVIVRQVIGAGATDLGRVMGQVMPQFKGRVDGRVINRIVREELEAR